MGQFILESTSFSAIFVAGNCESSTLIPIGQTIGIEPCPALSLFDQLNPQCHIVLLVQYLH